MKTRSYLFYALFAFMQSCCMVDAQVVWLSTKNPDFTDCDREERVVKPFEGVSNTCPFDVIVEQSDEQYVIVEGDEEYFERLHTNVRRGVLEIEIDPARYRNVRLRVKVGTPELTQICLAGSGTVICKSDIVTEGDFALISSGSGDVDTKKIKCADFQASVAGSSNVSVLEVESVEGSISLAGSGDLDIRRFKSENLTISLAGSGDVEIGNVDIENTLTASVAGSGDIDVSGKAHSANAKVVGSGDISGRLIYDNLSKMRSGSGDIDW